MLGDSPVNAILPCVDLAGARKFYGETLGLTEVQFPGLTGEAAEASAAEAALYACGGGTFLVVYARETPTQADHTAAGWMVADFDAVAEDLLNRGVKFESYPDLPGTTFDDRGIATAEPGYKTAWFKDPEGNILSIFEMTA
ncbi:MAG: VOC family protein [Candidatus Promineifilaceae bacterium]|jgi:catechol 2,3-dioxygenase-like lactoylglutathione lyase family enzyme